MPRILYTAYKHRNDPPPDFVDYMWIARYLHMSTDTIRKSGILDGVRSRYNELGWKLFKRTAVLDAIERYHLSPPDDMHPLHEFTQAEAMLELSMKPDTFTRFVKEGKIHLHVGKDGYKKVYRKDVDWFRRNFDPLYVVMNITEPVMRSVAVMALGRSMNHFRAKLEKRKIPRMPRNRGEYVKFSKNDLLAFLNGLTNKFYRKEELPEMLPCPVARLYSGFSSSKIENLKMTKRWKSEFVMTDHGRKWCVSKSSIDRIIDEDADAKYYCTGRRYYTRTAIKYKFDKTDRWIDEFVKGKCRNVMANGRVYLPKDVPPGQMVMGWYQTDVDLVIESGVECKIVRKRKRPPRPAKEASSMAALATPPVVFSNPVEQMEAAIQAAIDSKEASKLERKKEIRRKLNAEHERLNAIREMLSGGPAEMAVKPSRNDILRLSDERQIVTILFGDSTVRGTYIAYPHAKDECIFRVTCTTNYGRRKIPPSFARAIVNGLKNVASARPKVLPAWIVIAQSMTAITDPVFHETLKRVPGTIGAVAPFGYDGLLPDGSWARNPITYGGYGLYSERTGEKRNVRGSLPVDAIREVEFMDGPFVAVRGEYMAELDALSNFQQMGDARGFLVPIMSGICMKYGIRMGVVPVDSWGVLEYAPKDGTPEMNLCIERVKWFRTTPDKKIMRK